MLVDMNGVIYSLSYALDCIEAEAKGVQQDHSKWVAYLSTLIGKQYGFTADELSDLSSCAALHDNALTQYLSNEINTEGIAVAGVHCLFGEENVQDFPFRTNAKGFILYHHENIDGSGPFGKKIDEIPIQAHIIHLADMMDFTCRFHDISEEAYERVQDYLAGERDKMYAGELIDTFFRIMPKDKYMSLHGENIDELLDAELPHTIEEYPFEKVKAVMDVFGKIVDYKSPFTRNHSAQIANKIFLMAEEYGYDKAMIERMYVAGALHDIGKMAIVNDILEKPGRLTASEFEHMQKHAWYTYTILDRIAGFEDITEWASLHHEKLNGTGYPFGRYGEELSEQSRLLACIDIYQALREDRPYKLGMPHVRCIEIMRKMVTEGLIDAKITDDIDRIFRISG